MRMKTRNGGGRLIRLAAGVAACSLLLSAGVLPSFCDELQAQTPQADSGQPPAADAKVGTADGASPSVGETTSQVTITPGKPIAVSFAAEDLQPTDDINVAMQQAAAYPDSPEAAFLYAVALTRTSQVEAALKQVKHAKDLAAKQGGPAYFDRMIDSYEKMIVYCPDDNRVRYTLAWAYYMKAYVLSKTAGRGAGAQPAAVAVPARKKEPKLDPQAAGILAIVAPNLSKSAAPDGKVTASSLPQLPNALAEAPPSVQGQVRGYYDQALKNLDDMLMRKPDDVWARVYRAHLELQETGDVAAAMKVWKQVSQQAPSNPAPYFFMAAGYLQMGDLKQSIGNISRAIALRAIGN
ncbi:MAG TPA: tetratricopeptide repeat protein [Planktothrix sp.]